MTKLTCYWTLLQWSQWPSQSLSFLFHCRLHNENLRSNQYVTDIAEILNIIPFTVFSLIFMFIGWANAIFLIEFSFLICLDYTECLNIDWIIACIWNLWKYSNYINHVLLALNLNNQSQNLTFDLGDELAGCSESLHCVEEWVHIDYLAKDPQHFTQTLMGQWATVLLFVWKNTPVCC